MSRRDRAWALVTVLMLVAGCDQLGNPEQYATGPTAWSDNRIHIVTTTRSFRDEKTIRRLVSQDLTKLDYADASIGPRQTLTLVSVVPRGLRSPRGQTVHLVTVFKIPGGRPIARRWSASSESRHWRAAFAMPAPPSEAVTSLAP